MEEEVMIKYESGNEDDEIEALFKLWKENLQYFDERELKQHAETLVSDITKFIFDFTSDSLKYNKYANLFIVVAKSNAKLHDATSVSVDLYWIQKQLFLNLMLDDDIGSYEKYFYELILDTSTKSADENISCSDVKVVDAGLISDILTKEFLAARYLMRNLYKSKRILHSVINDLKFKNIRNFMDSILKHDDIPLNNIENLIEIFENSEINLHNCILENQIFLLDFLLSNVLIKLDNSQLKKTLNLINSNGSNIFHLACEKRIKFLIEELWILIQKAYDSDAKQIEKYLLSKDENNKNAFMLAFQMPLKYSNMDYANEIKSRSRLLCYYKSPGLLEIEMYNFESSLNLIYNIVQNHICDKLKKCLILGNRRKMEKCYDKYEYSKDFRDFRHDFIQLRFYCVSKISSTNTSNMDSVTLIYNFLSRYIDQFFYQQCDSEEAIVALYQKLSYDAHLTTFFKVFVQNNFNQALSKMTTPENMEQLMSITKKVLTQNEHHKLLTKSGANGNNALQLAINSGNLEMYRLVWSSFNLNNSAIANWILGKNIDGMNSLYLIIYSHQTYMLQSMLNYFSATLEEEQIMYILENTQKANYKFIDIAVLYYDPTIFDLLIDFIQNHMSAKSQRQLLGKGIISLAVSRWQESALTKVLNLIEALFDENEIKEILYHKNWEGQTAFHLASKNRNINHLQQLCKFAHYYLTKESFIEIIKEKDNSEYSIVINDQISDEVLFNQLPKLSNFYSTYPIYEWIPISNLQFPKNSFTIGSDNEINDIFIAKIYESNEDNNSEQFVEIKTLSKNSQIDFDAKYVEVLVGRGLTWCLTNSKNASAMKVENNGTFHITKYMNDIIILNACSQKECEILCTTDQNLLEIEDDDRFIFKRVN